MLFKYKFEACGQLFYFIVWCFTGISQVMHLGTKHGIMEFKSFFLSKLRSKNSCTVEPCDRNSGRSSLLQTMD